MGFRIYIIFLIIFSSVSGSAQINNFQGLTFTNTSDPFNLAPSNYMSPTLQVNKGDKLIFLTNKEAKKIPGYKEGDAYFKVSSSSPSNKRPGEYFKTTKGQFESQIYQGQYSNFVKEKFLIQRIPHIKKATKRFEGKNLKISSSHIVLNYQGFDLKIKKGEKLQVVDSSKFKNIRDYDPNKIYFQRIDKETGKVRQGDYYTIPAVDFEKSIKDGAYGNWARIEYEKISPINYLDKVKPVEASVPIPMAIPRTKPSGSVANKPTVAPTVTVTPSSKPVTNTVKKPKIPARTENQEAAYRSIPTPKGSVETAAELTKFLEEEFNKPMIECPDFDKKLKDNYEQCNPGNDYAQSSIKKLLNPEDLKSSAAGKFCILAGLKKEISFKVALCRDSNLISTRTQVCASNEYVSFVHKELTQMSDCFTNIHYNEMLPLMNSESQFNYNAYNLNSWGEFKGQLNASGLLQTTQVLVTDANNNKAYITDNGDKDLFAMKYNDKSNYCKSIIEEVKKTPPSTKRSACDRTGIPDGFRKSLYLAMANYSFYKQTVESELEATAKAYFPGKELFKPEDKEKLLVDLTRLMHSRGIGVFKLRMRSFFYDLFHGKKGQYNRTKIEVGKRKVEVKKDGKTQYDENGKTITKVIPGTTSVRHGNASIYKLWGRPGFKAPLTHEAFISNFSSYIFWEGKYGKNKRGSQGRKFEPSDSNRDSEGGTYLHKMACDQKLLNENAKKLSKNQNVECGYPKISPDRMEHTQVEAGWYLNVCKATNRSVSSRRTCSAKDPYKATDSADKRRLTDVSIKQYTNDEGLLRQCDHESLHGMASRPLIEFYAPNPGKYQ